MSIENRSFNPGALQVEMVEYGVPQEIVKRLFDHEIYGHYMNDAKRHGEFGYRITSGWVVAYYMIIGPRDPKELMKIAAGPGKSEMSEQDWNVYDKAFKSWMNKLKEENELKESDLVAENDLTENLVDHNNIQIRAINLIKEKIDEFVNNGNFPSLNNLHNSDISDLMDEHGDVVRHAIKEAYADIMREDMELVLQS